MGDDDKTIEATPSHPGMASLLSFFSYEHLPPHMQEVSKKFHALAHAMGNCQGPEATAGMRKLLEAKDCFVRATMVRP